MQETEKIWMNGELVDWADAKVHVGVHGLHYGSGVFEGIRCYDTPKGPAVFRLTRAHAAPAQLGAAARTCRSRTRSTSCATALQRAARRQRAARVLHPADRLLRLRPAGRRRPRQPGRDGDHELAVGHATSARRGCARASARRSRQLAADQRERHPARLEGDRRVPQLDARGRRGEPAPATTRRSCSRRRGTVADGSGENIFVVRDGVLYTPDLATGILPGITRDTIMQIAAGPRLHAWSRSR